MLFVVIVCALTTLGGYLFKAQCLQPWDGRQYSSGCYNDIQALYAARGVDANVFPYVNGSLNDDELVDGAIEYPVLTGLFMWATGLGAQGDDAYLETSGLVLAPFAVLIAFLLTLLAGRRALMWAASPALFLYAFHNWDLLVVAAAVAGIWLWARGQPLWAAVLFGIGGAFKLYPLFFLAPLVAALWFQRERRSALAAGATGIGTWVAINLPFVVANLEGWWATYEFHRLRLPDWNSIWIWLAPTWEPGRVNLVSGALTVASFVAIVGVGWWRASREDRFPFVQVCGALLAAFLIWNKVHSPQYALWIMPFFVLLRIHIVWWVAYSLVDLLVYVSIFRWFYDFGYRNVEVGEWKRWLITGVWLRAALLAGLVVLFLRAKDAVLSRRVGEMSYPAPSVASDTARA